MTALIDAKGIRKYYGDECVLQDVNLSIEAGRIVGLIGPNGAGKTTLLKGILGLAPVQGELSVMGFDPIKQRTRLLQEVSFVADIAILPRWLKVKQAVDYVAGVHPRFNREKAQRFLSQTSIKQKSKVGDLSKGMVAQLHLALIMAIDSRLLVLDEPTLGLDIIYRKQFYSTLLNDYFDSDKTIVITTHQVEEIENILTDILFIQDGKIVLDSSMESLAERFLALQVTSTQKQALLDAGLRPISESARLGGSILLFENVSKTALSEYGEIQMPSVADVFVAKMGSSLNQGEGAL